MKGKSKEYWEKEIKSTSKMKGKSIRKTQNQSENQSTKKTAFFSQM